MATKRKFSFVFHINLEAIRHPERETANNGRVFVLRTRGTTRELAAQQVAQEFDSPVILAAFDGWPEIFRGETIESMADVVVRYGPEAMKAEAIVQMAEAVSHNSDFTKRHPS
jgi:hypothetical protein